MPSPIFGKPTPIRAASRTAPRRRFRLEDVAALEDRVVPASPVALSDAGFTTSEDAVLTVVASAPGPISNAGADMLANEIPDNANEGLNPNATAPVWSYGQRGTTLGPALTLYTASNHVNDNTGVLDGFSDLNVQCCGRLPFILVNTGPAASLPQGSLATGEILIHPDGNAAGGFAGEEKAVVRYTAAVAGNYSVSALWEDVDSCCTQNGGAGVDVHVVRNRAGVSTSFFDAAISREADALPTSTNYAGVIGLGVGDSIDFVVGTNSQLFGDATRFNALVQYLGGSVLFDNGNGPDTDADGDTLTVTGFSPTSSNGATITVAANGGFTYNPLNSAAAQALPLGGTLTDTFTYNVSDGNGGTATATVSVVVTGVNDAPVLTPVSFTINDTAASDTFSPVSGTLAAVDADSSGLTFGLTGSIADGSVAGFNRSRTSGFGTLYLNTSTGAYRFVPNSAAINPLSSTTTDPFTITVSDGALSDSETLTVTFAGVNDDPIARNDAGFVASEDTVLTVSANSPGIVSNAGADMLANESPNNANESQNPNATAPIWSYGQRGTTLGPALTLFTAGNHENGVTGTLDGFSDVNGLCCGRLPSVYVNTGPAAGFPEGSVATGELVLHPDGNIAGGFANEEKAVVRYTATVAGNYSVNALWEDINSCCTQSGGAGVDVHVVGIRGGVSTSFFDAAISREADALPTSTTYSGIIGLAIGDSIDFVVGTNGQLFGDATRFNAFVQYLGGGVLVDNGSGADSDIENDTLTVAAFDAISANGATITVAADGSFTYDARTSLVAQMLAAGETLTDAFTYTLSDGNGGTSTATVSVLVNGVSDAVFDSYTLDEDNPGDGIDLVAADVDGTTPDTTPASGTFDSVLANDDPAGALEVLSVQSAQSGGVQYLPGSFGVFDGQTTFLTDQGGQVVMHDDGTFTYDQQGVFDSLMNGQTATDSFTYTYLGGIIKTYDPGIALVANELTPGAEANPNPVDGGVWSYGKRGAIAGTSFTPLTIHTNGYAGNAGLQGWLGGESNCCGVSFPATVANVSGGPITDAANWGAPGGPMPANSLVIHPATGNAANPFNVVRWTAPAAGAYSLLPTWTDFSSGGNNPSRGVDVHIVVNGVSIYDAILSLENDPTSASATRIVSLQPGDTVDFVVGPNGASSDAYFNDGTIFTGSVNLISSSATVFFTIHGVEDPPTQVYVDDAWAGFTDGQTIADADPVVIGLQPATFGYDAFTSLVEAFDAVEVGGTVIVNAGDYLESASVDKSITINFQEDAILVSSLSTTVTTATFHLNDITLSLGAGAISSPVAGTGGLTKVGPGTLAFTGAGANSYSGTTRVNDGVLSLAKAGAESVVGPIVIGDALGGSTNGKTAILRVDASEQIADASVISFVGNDGRLHISSAAIETIAAPAAFAAGDIKIAGVLITTGAYTQTGGSTTLAGGTLRVGADGTLDLSLTGALQGSGTIFTGMLTSFGTIDPSSGMTDADVGNASPGRITIRGNLQMTASSVTNLDVGSGGGDQLNVGINTALPLPAGSYSTLSNYDLDPYLRGDVAGVSEPTRRGVNNLANVNGTVRFHGALNVRPIVGFTPVHNTTSGNAMNFVWRALSLPTGGLNPRTATLTSVPSDFTSRNSLTAAGLPATPSDARFEMRYMGSAGQVNAIGQVVAATSGANAILYAPAYVLGQAKSMTLTALTSTAGTNAALKMSRQVWNAFKDAHSRVTVTVTNTGAVALAGPFYLEIASIPAGATVFNASGKTQANRPYLVVVPRNAAGAALASLAPGASATVELDLLTPMALGKSAGITANVLFGGLP